MPGYDPILWVGISASHILATFLAVAEEKTGFLGPILPSSQYLSVFNLHSV